MHFGHFSPEFRESLVVKTINTVTHRGCRGARPARREEGEYREYLTDEQHGRPGWIGIRMPSYLWSWPLRQYQTEVLA